jgi:glycosyltransferase involved in cell wall biosynthesis
MAGSRVMGRARVGEMNAASLNSECNLPVSAFIICKNEEKYIGGCISSLYKFNDIVVVDSGSTDRTLQVVQSFIDKGFPIRLFSQSWLGYAAQKQFALDQCREDWCFNVDADERVDDALLESLPQMLSVHDDVVGWRVARRPYLIGYGYTPPWERRL